MRRLMLALVTVALLVVTLTPAAAITNGEPDRGRHPYVGLVALDLGAADRLGLCSGSLLSPTVFLTAGHCTDGAVGARVWFDEDVESNSEFPDPGATSYDGVPHTIPGFCIGCLPGLPEFAARDVGVIVLTEPVPVAVVNRYAQLPSPRMVDALSSKARVELVGYGVQERLRGQGYPQWFGLLERLRAPARLVSGSFKHSDEFVRATASRGQGGGICFGDSGGPVLAGRTDTALAVNSYVTNINCAGVTYSQRIDVPDVLDWIESFLSR